MKPISMKWLVALISLVLTVPSYGQAFGLSEGQTLAQIQNLVPTLARPGIYHLDDVPTPNDTFERYFAILATESGLCGVRAIRSPDGSPAFVQGLFNSLAEDLISRYGNPFRVSPWDISFSFQGPPSRIDLSLLESSSGVQLRLTYLFQNNLRCQEELSQTSTDGL